MFRDKPNDSFFKYIIEKGIIIYKIIPFRPKTGLYFLRVQK